MGFTHTCAHFPNPWTTGSGPRRSQQMIGSSEAEAAQARFRRYPTPTTLSGPSGLLGSMPTACRVDGTAADVGAASVRGS
jgi:hypothetical protein